jgi:gliding motility-associated-like protein
MRFVQNKLYLLFFFTALMAGSVLWAQPEFVENKGQWPEQVCFKTSLGAGTLWTERDALTYTIYNSEEMRRMHGVSKQEQTQELHGHHYRLRFLNAQNGIPEVSHLLPHRYHYYLGSNPQQHTRDCRVSARGGVRQVYPQIDMVVYSSGSNLKYDWIVKPGGNPEQIQVVLEGATWSLRKAEEGSEVVIETSVQTIIEKAPYAYQLIDGRLVEVPCEYRMRGQVLSYELGSYDTGKPLVIDPEVAFSTYIGSPASSWGFTACDDSEGNLIAGAAVFAENYPTTVGAFSSSFNGASGNYMDMAVSKFSSDGTTLLYSTYIGGSLQETPQSVVVDGQDNIILFGVTGSSDYPTTPGTMQQTFVGGPSLSMQDFFVSSHPNGCDMFLAKFGTDGSLVASTFVGGYGTDGLNYADQLFYNYGDAFRGEVNVDANDNVIVASVTRSQDFPVTSGSYGGGNGDGVLFMLTPGLNTLIAGRYVGGSGADACYGVEFNPAGQLIVSGGTQSVNFPLVSSNAVDGVFSGETDGFITILDPLTLSLLNGTLVGTIEYDQVYFAQSDNSGNIYAYGQTTGTMSITPGCYGQPNSGQFISKYSPSLDQVIWTTTVGTGSGAIDISPTAFLVSNCEQIYFSGWGGEINTNWCSGQTNDCYATQSTTTGFPTTSDAFQTTTDGSDFYLGVLNPDATGLIYGSFLGGTISNEHVDGGTSRFDKQGSVYHAVCAGCGGNSDFPTTPTAWSNTNDSPQCNLAVFRFDLSAVQAEAAVNGPTQVCMGDNVAFENNSTGASTFEWDFGDGQTSTAIEPVHQFTSGGNFTVQLIGSDNALCVTSDTTTIELEVVPDVTPTIQADDVICLGQNIQLQATGSTNLHWLPSATLSALNVPNPTATPITTTTYYVVDENVCDAETLSVEITVSSVEVQVQNNFSLCVGQQAQLAATGGLTYTWSPATFLDDPTAAGPVCTPTASTTYIVTAANADGCEDDAQVVVDVFSTLPGGQTYPAIALCEGENVQLQAAAGNSWTWYPPQGLNNELLQDPVASPADTTLYQVTITNPCGSGIDEVQINVIHPEITAWGGGSICIGDSIAAFVSGAQEYYWRPGAYASPAEGQSVMLFPQNTTTFEVTGYDQFNCAATATVEVFVYPVANIEAGPDAYFDAPDSVMLYGNALGFPCYWWPSEGLSCDTCEQPLASPLVTTVYHLAIIDEYGCVNEDSVTVRPYFPVYVPNSFTPNGDGLNDIFLVRGLPQEGFHLQIFDRWGNLVFETFDMEDPWIGQGPSDYYVTTDVYNWVVEFDSRERRSRLIGHVTVVR